jgi:hypothetical protein
VPPSLLNDLHEFFGCEHVVPVGSGTIGLTLTLRSLGVRGKQVLMPALTCPAVALAAIAAGATPRPVDVCAADGTLAVDAVGEAIDRDVGAIVAVDPFGYPASYTELRRLADRFGCPVIEDACQSYGGHQQGKAMGTLAPVGVVSFGYTKNIDLGAGGLVLTDDAAVAADVRALQSAPDYRWLSAVRSRVLLRMMVRGHERWFPLLARYAGLLRYGFPRETALRLREEWPAFRAGLPAARDDLMQVGRLIAGFAGVVPFGYRDEGWLPWRYSFMAAGPEERERLEALMSSAGVRLTRLYPVLKEPFSSVPPASFPVAGRLADAILNIKHGGGAAEARELRARLERLASRADAE